MSMMSRILDTKFENIEHEFLQFLVTEPKSKPHIEQLEEFDSFLSLFPNFEKDYLVGYEILSLNYTDINHRLILEHLRKSRNLRARMKKNYVFQDTKLSGILPRYIFWKYGEKLKNINFRFIPITYKGKGNLRADQAKALGVIK